MKAADQDENKHSGKQSNTHLIGMLPATALQLVFPQMCKIEVFLLQKKCGFNKKYPGLAVVRCNNTKFLTAILFIGNQLGFMWDLPGIHCKNREFSIGNITKTIAWFFEYTSNGILFAI